MCFGGGEHKNFWGDAFTQPRPDAFGMPQQSVAYFASDPMLSSFGIDFALKFGGEAKNKNKKKGLRRKILGYLDHVHAICFGVS